MDILIRGFYKTFLLLVLLVIVDVTSNDTNETPNEHRQSRVTGRIVKIYSGTRPDPVTCNGEGFQADPHNCAIFYRCMKSGNGKYSVFKFQCGPGTVYDPETEVCNHPHSTKRSECGGSLPTPVDDRISNNEIENEDIRQEVPSPITTSKTNYTNKPETEKTTFTQIFTTTGSPLAISTSTKHQAPDLSAVFTSQSPWGSSLGGANIEHTISPLILPPTTAAQNQQYNEVPKNVLPPNVPQTSRQDNICTSDGFMGDTEDCRKFYRCVANQRGTYTRFEFSCSESTIWDDDTQSCNHAWAVKRSRCGRSGQQSNAITNEGARPTAGTEVEPNLKAKTIQEQLQISYGPKVTQTQTQISNGSVVQNQTQINYGDRTSPKQGSRAKQNQTQISHGSATSQSQMQIDYSDKGVQTQLQIDHSQQSSQSQTQIHESTTRGTLTSVAQSNTQQGNQCSRAGFMGDTNDCKKFYRCIDNGRGSYMKFEFSCGEGTVWDQSIEACNHAWAVKECGGKDTAGSTSTTQSSVTTPKTTQSPTTASTENYQTPSVAIVTEDNEDDGYGQPSQNPTTQSSTTTSSTTTTTVTLVSSTPSSKGECTTSGFIGDPNDCKIFYRCVENGRGAFTKYEFKCGEGTVWDPDLEACNHAWAVKKCGGNASPDKVETTTGKQSTAYTDQTTQSTVIMQPSTERPSIDYDDSGYDSGNNVFTTTTTSTTTITSRPSSDQNTGSICRSSGFMGDANDCKKFYRCVDNGNGGYTRYEFSCGEGTVWDSQIDACNHVWAVKNCGGAGSIDNAQETTSQSKPTTSHEIITSSSTESVQNTVSPISAPSTTSSTAIISGSQPIANDDCTRSGFMGDRKDCKKFYRCVDNGNGSYTKYEFSCGEGTVWDQKIEACNHAWAVEKCGSSVESSSEHHETSTQHHNTISDEIDDGYPSNQEAGQTTTQSTTTSVLTEASKVPSNDNNCVSSGFMGDKNDCKKFYRCVDDGNNGFTRYEFSCGEGTLWDQSIEACNHAWAVKDCGQTGNNTQHVSSETTTQATATSTTEDQVYPHSTERTTTTLTVSGKPDDQSNMCLTEGFKGDRNDCKKFYRCVDNGRGGFTKYEFACGDGTYWNQEILACDHTSSNKNCGETSGSTSTQIYYPEQDEMQTEAATASSSSTTESNNDYSTQKPPVSSGVCTSEGFYGDMNDCKKFYRCVDNGKGGYTKYDFTCGDGTVWNQDIQACDHETNNNNCSSRPASGTQTTESPQVAGNDYSTSSSTESQYSTEMTVTSSSSTSSPSSSSSYNCESEGFFAHPDDCKKFIRCVNNDKGGYTRYEFACGEGTVWVQDILACDHDTGDSNCKSPSSSKPTASNGGQQTTTERHDVDESTTSMKPQIPDKQEDEYDSDSANKPTQSGSDKCTSEGFYANKNDCRQFYRCVDNGQGGYTKYDFTCGEGTAWDSEVQTCNHIEQVKSCQGESSQPVMHEENNGQTTESINPSKTTTTESTGVSQSSTTESSSTSKTTTAASNQGSSHDNKNTCESEGYFGDKQDCKKFYRCVDNGKGGYTKYDFTCGEGTIWDQDITTCNHPQDVVNPSCNQQEGSSTSTTSSSASGGSSEATTEGTDSSQTTSSTQSTTSTQSSGNCSQEEGSKKPENQNITCTQAGYFANPNDCKKFYRCVDWDGDGKRFSVYHFDCGEGTIWDPAVETCNHEESVYPPRDCSGSQSQSENQPSTEQTTTTQQESTTTDKSSTTESSTTQSTTSEPSTTEQSTSTTQSSTSEQTTTETSSTSEQTTQSSTTEQTTTQQSTTSEQTTQQSSSSEQTTTQSSTTSEQTTQSSTTSEQTTQSSTTSEQTITQSSTTEQTTQQSTTSEQTTEQTTTQQSTTSEQTTEQSTTSEQTTQQSTTSEQTTEQTTQQSTTEQTTQQSTTSEQTTEQTTTQESTTSEQTTQESTTSEQTTQESTTSEQTTQESTTSEQTTQESTTSEQTTQESTTSEQTTQESTTEQSTTEQSTTSDSTTESSTTEQSTQQSTTGEQSTTEQSTTESTTSEGTTQETTEQSTTESQDNSTTESSNTEQSSDSKCPETEDGQNLFVCPTSFRRHPKYCNLFYQCDEEDDTHDVKIAVFTCPNNTIYDESQTRCVEEKKADKKCNGEIAQKRRFKRFDKDYKEPIVVTKDSYACKSAGYFSFEKDSECSPAFLKCKTDKNKKVKGVVYQCPSGFVYWSISKRCEPVNRVRDCKRSHNNWAGRWEIPVERRNVARP